MDACRKYQGMESEYNTSEPEEAKLSTINLELKDNLDDNGLTSVAKNRRA